MPLLSKRAANTIALHKLTPVRKVDVSRSMVNKRTIADVIASPLNSHLASALVRSAFRLLGRAREAGDVDYFYDRRERVWIVRSGDTYLAVGFRVNRLVLSPKWVRRYVEQKLDGSKDCYIYPHEPGAGSTIVDVGAGDGADSILFSRLAGPEGRVLAIEAQPDTVRLLRATCRLNRLSNVTIVHSAVTDSIGRIGITDLGNSLANHGVPESQNPGCSIIDTTTIDGLCDKYSILTVDYLKMNIEGAELHAIKGMQTSIGKVHRACIACHDFLNTDGGGRIKETVTDFMEFHGFKVHRRVNDERPWVRDHLYCDRTPQESVAS